MQDRHGGRREGTGRAMAGPPAVQRGARLCPGMSPEAAGLHGWAPVQRCGDLHSTNASLMAHRSAEGLSGTHCAEECSARPVVVAQHRKIAVRGRRGPWRMGRGPWREGRLGACQRLNSVACAGTTCRTVPRLGFARLFWHHPKFALMDEATSALDVPMEAKCLGECQRRNITLISVAHRPTVIKYDDASHPLTRTRTVASARLSPECEVWSSPGRCSRCRFLFVFHFVKGRRRGKWLTGPGS